MAATLSHVSSGRGGSGNIHLPPSPPKNAAGVGSIRKSNKAPTDLRPQFFSVGRGGLGNLQATADLVNHPQTAAILGEYQKVLWRYETQVRRRHAESQPVVCRSIMNGPSLILPQASCGRGGKGNITDARQRPRCPSASAVELDAWWVSTVQLCVWLLFLMASDPAHSSHLAQLKAWSISHLQRFISGANHAVPKSDRGGPLNKLHTLATAAAVAVAQPHSHRRMSAMSDTYSSGSSSVVSRPPSTQSLPALPEHTRVSFLELWPPVLLYFSRYPAFFLISVLFLSMSSVEVLSRLWHACLAIPCMEMPVALFASAPHSCATQLWLVVWPWPCCYSFRVCFHPLKPLCCASAQMRYWSVRVCTSICPSKHSHGVTSEWCDLTIGICVCHPSEHAPIMNQPESVTVKSVKSDSIEREVPGPWRVTQCIRFGAGVRFAHTGLSLFDDQAENIQSSRSA